MQTSYNQFMDEAVLGMPADNGPKDVISRANVTDEIRYGHFVAQVVSNDEACEQPDSSGAIMLGAAIRPLQKEGGQASVENAYPADSDVSIMRKGRMWVWAEKAVTLDDSVFIRHTASGGNTVLGTVRDDADSSTAVAATNVRFLTATSGAGMVKVEINMP